MKKHIISCLLALVGLSAGAQNLQVHYDFGRHLNSTEKDIDRQFMTLTFEQFKADKLGSWYYFIDMDIADYGFRSAYTEISREFTFAKASETAAFAAHAEFNGGLGVDKFNGETKVQNGYRFQPCVLVGAAYNGHSKDWTKTWSLQLLYKQFVTAAGGHRAYSSFQVTGIWGLNFCNNKLTFSGFLDLWRGEKDDYLYVNGKQNHGMLVLLTEPQLWYNFNKHFSAGTEVEISNNFIVNYLTTQTCFVNPTLAVKYNF